MSWLLDTNILSEMVKERPNQGVISWIDSQTNADLFLSTITIAEIERGVNRLPQSQKRKVYESFLLTIIKNYGDNIIPINLDEAREWGKIMARSETIGRRLPVADAFIAATASIHDLTLVTRNVSDFEAVGLKLLNPWE
ncbi:MAG: type II toxin-antitoxin system VapC family toxin [Chloroflexota bacterium]